MSITPDAVFCAPTASVEAWTQSTAPDGQAASGSDVQGVLQQRPGSTCPAGQTRLFVNTGQSAAYLVAYDARPLPVADATTLFAFGFVGMLVGPRLMGLLIREFRSWARSFW